MKAKAFHKAYNGYHVGPGGKYCACCCPPPKLRKRMHRAGIAKALRVIDRIEQMEADDAKQQ